MAFPLNCGDWITILERDCMYVRVYACTHALQYMYMNACIINVQYIMSMHVYTMYTKEITGATHCDV